MPGNLSSLIAYVLMLGGCLAASVISTGRPRYAAGALAAAMVLSVEAQKLTDSWTPTFLLLLIDMALLIAFLAIAWKPPRLWPVILVGLQGLIVAIDAIKLAQPRLQAYAYASAVILASYGLVVTLVYGAWTARWWRR